MNVVFLSSKDAHELYSNRAYIFQKIREREEGTKISIILCKLNHKFSLILFVVNVHANIRHFIILYGNNIVKKIFSARRFMQSNKTYSLPCIILNNIFKLMGFIF